MGKSKVLAVICVVIALVLLGVSVAFGFLRAANVNNSYLLSADLNAEADVKLIEKAVKKAGAKNCVVETFDTGTGVSYGVNVYFLPDKGVAATDVFAAVETELQNTYLLKADGTLSTVSYTLNNNDVFALWPALIVLVLLLVYVAIRYGVRYALTALFSAFVPVGVLAGIVSLAGLYVSEFTVAAALMAVALELLFTVNLASSAEAEAKRTDDACAAFAAAVKKEGAFALAACLLTAIASALLLILASGVLKSFGLTALIASALSAVTALFVLPGLVRLFGKAK